jgi:hypothetical protein
MIRPALSRCEGKPTMSPSGGSALLFGSALMTTPTPVTINVAAAVGIAVSICFLSSCDNDNKPQQTTKNFWWNREYGTGEYGQAGFPSKLSPDQMGGLYGWYTLSVNSYQQKCRASLSGPEGNYLDPSNFGMRDYIDQQLSNACRHRDEIDLTIKHEPLHPDDLKITKNRLRDKAIDVIGRSEKGVCQVRLTHIGRDEYLLLRVYFAFVWDNFSGVTQRVCRAGDKIKVISHDPGAPAPLEVRTKAIWRSKPYGPDWTGPLGLPAFRTGLWALYTLEGRSENWTCKVNISGPEGMNPPLSVLGPDAPNNITEVGSGVPSNKHPEDIEVDGEIRDFNPFGYYAQLVSGLCRGGDKLTILQSDPQPLQLGSLRIVKNRFIWNWGLYELLGRSENGKCSITLTQIDGPAFAGSFDPLKLEMDKSLDGLQKNICRTGDKPELIMIPDDKFGKFLTFLVFVFILDHLGGFGPVTGGF